MEFNHNGTKLLLEVKEDGLEGNITHYSIEKGKGLVLNLQVSGEIQSFDQVEVGLYTSENVPLCQFGPFVKTMIPTSRFLMSMKMIPTGVYHPQHQSQFAHVVFWSENNKNKGAELDLKETLKFWNQQLPDQDQITLKLMLSGSTMDNKQTFMRDINVVKLIP